MTSRSWITLPFTATSARSHSSITPTNSVITLTAAKGLLTRLNAEEAKTASPPSHAQPNVADQIKKLADLHAAGILTDEEFATKKADLLNRM